MSKKYTYKICSKCKQEKEENSKRYCRDCSKAYDIDYRKKRSIKTNIDIDGLGSFINHIISCNNYLNRKNNTNDDIYMDDTDIKNLLFFYELISFNVNEYDNNKKGKPNNCWKQYLLMWAKVFKYYINNKKIKGN